MDDKEKLRHSEDAIRQALKDVWAAATNQPDRKALMSIPPRPDKDADFILHDALDELFELRTVYDARQKEIDELREQVKWWAINWQKIRELQKQKQTDAAVFLGRTIMLEADTAAKKILEG